MRKHGRSCIYFSIAVGKKNKYVSHLVDALKFIRCLSKIMVLFRIKSFQQGNVEGEV
jgi:hypothetical protein